MNFDYGLSLTEDEEKQYTWKYRSCFTQEYSWFDVETGEEAPSDVIIYFLKKEVFNKACSYYNLSKENISLKLKINELELKNCE